MLVLVVLLTTARTEARLVTSDYCPYFEATLYAVRPGWERIARRADSELPEGLPRASCSCWPTATMRKRCRSRDRAEAKGRRADLTLWGLKHATREAAWNAESAQWFHRC